MLDYIKKQIHARNMQAEQEKPAPENVPNEVITEYASIFQELDAQLSEEGADAGKVRKMELAIPLEEDPEIESVEISLDGTLEDVPGDASANTEEIVESYQTMKTYDEFFQEATTMVDRLMRESDDHYNQRVSEVADKMYKEYCEDAERIGDFGFNKIPVNDAKVPSKLLVDFGVFQEGSNFVSKVNVFYATDDDHNIIKKQLDSVRLIQEGAFKNIGPSLKAYMESTYNVPAEENVWNVCTPKTIIVPKGNGDSFCAVLEYANEITGKSEFFGWTKPVIFQEGLFKKNTDGKKTMDADEAKKLIKMNIKNSSCGQAFQKPTTTVDLVEDSGEIIITSPDGAKVTSKGFSFKDENGKTKTVRKAKLGKKWVVESVDIEGMERVNMESFVMEGHYENPSQVTKKAMDDAVDNIYKQTVTERKMPSRFFQETIDFGGGDGGSDLPPAEGGNDAPPATDAPAADTNGDAATPAEGEDDKKVATVNDVSSEIANRVQDKTQAEADAVKITFPDENPPAEDNATTDTAPSVDTTGGDTTTTDTSTDDTSDVDTSSLDSVAAPAEGGNDDIEGIDNTATADEGDDFATSDDLGSDEEDMGDDVDLSNMTIDEIMDQANEKVKGMTLDEIKNFIATAPQSEIQEAFFLTKKNINKEVDVRLREALGVLNDNKMNIDSLVKKFKNVGHRLNRVLTKATKMSAVYSSDEVNDIKKLNTYLTELLVSLKKKDDAAAIPVIKRQITNFTNQSKIVGAFVEDKLNAKPVQEAFLLSNITDKITKALIPVKGNMEELKKLHDGGTLSRGRIVKKYSAKSSNALTAIKHGLGSTGKSSNMPGGDHGVSGYSKYALNIDNALKLLNKAIRKKDTENLDLISTLADKLDLISDYIETVIDDSVENKEMIKRIGILSGEIITLIDQFIGDGSTMNAEPTNTDAEGSIPESGDFDDYADDADIEGAKGEIEPEEKDAEPAEKEADEKEKEDEDEEGDEE